MTSLPKRTLELLKDFLKQLKQLTWLEVFEKWFGLAIKLIWVILFVAFGIYLRKEYKKDIYYLQDFKVPPSWVEQGYSGDVVKMAINDEIDKIANIVYEDDESVNGKDEDNTQILSDLSIDGFNLKAVTKSILGIFGKKNKTIGGYVTVKDTASVMSVQVTDLISQPVSINKKESTQKLINKAALEIMKVKMPRILVGYYMAKNDTIMAQNTFKYLKKHRGIIKDYYFYDLAMSMALYENDVEKAQIWTDSLEKKYPNDKLIYYEKARTNSYTMYYTKSDSITIKKNKQLLVENLQNMVAPERTSEAENNLDRYAYRLLGGYYYREKKYQEYRNTLDQLSKIEPLTAAMYNGLAYSYIYEKNYSKAEELLKKTTFLASDIGDYWDSLAELYSLQGKDSLVVGNLKRALNSPKIYSPNVSISAFKTDKRWDRLRNRRDFQELLKIDVKKTK
jgi:hypothetical protein